MHYNTPALTLAEHMAASYFKNPKLIISQGIIHISYHIMDLVGVGFSYCWLNLEE